MVVESSINWVYSSMAKSRSNRLPAGPIVGATPDVAASASKNYAQHTKTFFPDGELITASAGAYTNIEPNVSVRAGASRSAYESFRPEEVIPNGRSQGDLQRVMVLCRQAYEKCGLVHSVIDMMSEFAAEGITIAHEDPKIEAWYNEWRQKVDLEDRAERFASWLCKAGNVVVHRRMGTMTPLRGSRTYTIPIGYIFYDPSTVDVVGGPIGALSTQKRYALKVPISGLSRTSKPNNALEKEVYNGLPEVVKELLEGRGSKASPAGTAAIPLPTSEIYVAYYKKDDSDIWARSFIYPILGDIIVNEKLKLAKTGALDNFNNVIRIWKLGDHKAGMFPGPAIAQRLHDILQQNTGGGTTDLIWDSLLEYEDHYPPIEKLANFTENDHAILQGLGVSEAITGGEVGGKSGSSNPVGMKNLVKRLESIRRVIRTWLEGEIAIVQAEMGFPGKPVVRFAVEDLQDEKAYYNLLVQLVDRNIISNQTVIERIKEFPDLERSRLSNEEKLRTIDALPEKAGPFHNPSLEDQQQFEMDKLKLAHRQNMAEGGISDRANTTSNMARSKGTERAPRGRPAGSKDKSQRTRGPNKTGLSVAQLLLEASRIHDELDDRLIAQAVERAGVKDVRQLTSEQRLEVDRVKHTIFAFIPPLSQVTDEQIEQAKTLGTFDDYEMVFAENLESLPATTLTVAQKRLLRIDAYVQSWV